MGFTTFIKRKVNKSAFLKRAYGAARWKLQHDAMAAFAAPWAGRNSAAE